MARTLDQVEAEIQVLQEHAAKLRATRDEAIIAAYTFTADDFRIDIEHDDCSYSFDDIVGDGAEEEEKNDPESFYYKAHQAYHNGDGVFAWGVIVQRRDPCTGEFESDESCWGFFSLGNWPDQDTIDCMMEFAKSCIPEGIKFDDIEGAL